jgi:hypothetical protein
MSYDCNCSSNPCLICNDKGFLNERELLTLGDRLSIEKKIDYISPSSFSNMMNQPNKFYLQRLINNPLPREPQGLAAANGSAFDYWIKKKLLDEMNRPYKEDELIQSIELKDEKARERALNVGKIFYTYYCLFIKKLNISWSFFSDVEIDRTFEFKGIPLRGKIDCVYISKYYKKPVPLDWKLTGSESKSSPTPKYQRLISEDEDCSHKDYYPAMPFELIDETWATQLCIYGWELGRSTPIWEEFDAQIHEMTITGTGKIRLAIFHGIITIPFQQKIYSNLKLFWESLQNGNYINTLANQFSKNLVYCTAMKETWY